MARCFSPQSWGTVFAGILELGRDKGFFGNSFSDGVLLFFIDNMKFGKKYGLVFAAALGLLCGGRVQAQIAEKMSFFGGMTYQIVATTPLGSPEPWYTSFYGFGLGGDYVLLHSNDQVSLGVNPNLNFCFQFSNFYGVSLLAQSPVYLLARLGAGATPFNEQKFGIGAGIGGSYSYMLHQISAQSGGGIVAVKYNNSFLNPGAVVELSLRTRMSDYIFRFNWSLLRPTLDVDVGSDTWPFRFGVTGFSIMYSF
jgi:hypothetical protein